MTAAATIEAKFIAEFEESPVATEGEAMNVKKEMANPWKFYTQD